MKGRRFSDGSVRLVHQTDLQTDSQTGLNSLMDWLKHSPTDSPDPALTNLPGPNAGFSDPAMPEYHSREGARHATHPIWPPAMAKPAEPDRPEPRMDRLRIESTARAGRTRS